MFPSDMTYYVQVASNSACAWITTSSALCCTYGMHEQISDYSKVLDYCVELTSSCLKIQDKTLRNPPATKFLSTAMFCGCHSHHHTWLNTYHTHTHTHTHTITRQATTHTHTHQYEHNGLHGLLLSNGKRAREVYSDDSEEPLEWL